MNELISKFIQEIAEDFEKNAQDKDIEEWMVEALKRHVPHLTDEEAQKVKDSLLEGIKKYRKATKEVEDIQDPELDKVADALTAPIIEAKKEEV